MKLPELNSKFEEDKNYYCINCGFNKTGIELRYFKFLEDPSFRCKCNSRPLYLFWEVIERED